LTWTRFCARFWTTVATAAAMIEISVINNAGATMPVMSSPVPRARNIRSAIPQLSFLQAQVKPLEELL